MSVLDRIGQKLLFSFDPETAHGLSIAALRCGLPVGATAPRDARLRIRLCGLDFPNPLGMAAGYDKNAEVPDALLGLGFGFAEVGTITPLPQPGNPKPRIFRLTADEAVINRLGFNNEGHAAAEKRLAARKGLPGVVGVN
ncbi:MAG: dihydroorotate dehydrogenase (quinone), partial [Mesorhizobium sp.]